MREAARPAAPGHEPLVDERDVRLDRPAQGNARTASSRKATGSLGGVLRRARRPCRRWYALATERGRGSGPRSAPPTAKGTTGAPPKHEVPGPQQRTPPAGACRTRPAARRPRARPRSGRRARGPRSSRRSPCRGAPRRRRALAVSQEADRLDVVRQVAPASAAACTKASVSRSLLDACASSRAGAAGQPAPASPGSRRSISAGRDRAGVAGSGASAAGRRCGRGSASR